MVTDEQIQDYLKVWGNQKKIASKFEGVDQTYLSKIANGKASVSPWVRAAFHYYFMASGEGPKELKREVKISFE